MNSILLDTLFALLIGGIIAWMATIKDPKIKSFVYILPFPISFVLLATGVHIDGTNVIGLGLVIVFLWMTYWLHDKFKLHIIIAGIIAACVYIALGYIAAQLTPPAFWLCALAYIVGWGLFVIFHTPPRSSPSSGKASKIHPVQKFMGVSLIAFILLRFKSFLDGIIVTFPFSGVFAVIESRYTLRTLASVATRNSIAILGMFAAIAYLPQSWPPLLLIGVGWVALLAILRIIYSLKIGRI